MFQVRLAHRAAIAICLMVSAGQSLATPESDAEPPDPVTAIWKIHRVEFNYRSTNIYYSCDGLRHKIIAIMKAVGARNSVTVDVRCRPGGVTNNAMSLITLATPVEATPENVTAATSYSPETQLAARLNKVQLPTANDIGRFPAEWRTVELNRNQRLNIGAGDCELLDGLISQVFPHVSVRVVKQRLNCSPGSSTRLRPVLHVAALVQIPVVPMAYAPVAD
jgi:hypothetical protein